jgi:hypothetical protein
MTDRLLIGSNAIKKNLVHGRIFSYSKTTAWQRTLEMYNFTLLTDIAILGDSFVMEIWR